MTTELVLAPDTELDLVEAYAWYEDLRPGLGAEFLGCVDACIETIVRRPQLYGAVHESYRRALVRRFPYAVFYEYSRGVATIYGVGLANLLFLPIADRLRGLIVGVSNARAMTVEGLLAIAEGDHPKSIEVRLGGYLEVR